MKKHEWIAQLRARLTGLPEEDLNRSVEYYSEMIDDRMEEGLSEEEAVAGIGDPDEIANGILQETPLTKSKQNKTRPKRLLRWWELLLPMSKQNKTRSKRSLRWWEILLLVFSPILLALLVVVYALRIALWAIVVALWAVGVAFSVASLAGCAVGVALLFTGNGLQGVFTLGIGLLLGGIAIFWFFGCLIATEGLSEL